MYLCNSNCYTPYGKEVRNVTCETQLAKTQLAKTQLAKTQLAKNNLRKHNLRTFAVREGFVPQALRAAALPDSKESLFWQPLPTLASVGNGSPGVQEFVATQAKTTKNISTTTTATE
jgi:hypothetical protein